MLIGDLRIALLNYICAKQANDTLHIRIEDTNTENNAEEKAQEILELLPLFGIAYHDISYQSHNLKFHQQLATKLLMDKNAFSCFCTANTTDSTPYNGTCENLKDEEVINNEAPFSIRLRRPSEDIDFSDTIQGEMHVDKNTIDSFMIMHVDKTPTHHFACALDDMLSDIALVIQGEEHLANTPKQILIRDYLGYDKQIEYAHLPTISGDNTPSVKELLEEGYLPSAISNYLIMIGNKTPTEIFDLKDAFAWFNLSHISKSPVKFDLTKLRQINREHIKRQEPMQLAKLLGFASKDLGELAKLYTKETSTLNEIQPKIEAIMATKSPSAFIDEFKTLQNIAKEAPYFAEYTDFKAHLEKESSLTGDNFSQPLRFLLTGENHGPDLGEIYPHIKHYLGEIIK
jgi:glutamyl-tRNA synthetase